MLKVLIVDDNRDCALTLAMLVRCMGHETVVTHDGFSAIKLASEISPDIILLDIGLPSINGHDVCRAIRSTEIGQLPVIIAHTAWGTDCDRQSTVDAGFDGHLVKPADLNSIQNVLQIAVARRAI